MDDVDAFLQSLDDSHVGENTQISIQENEVSSNQITFTYKLEGLEYETMLPSPTYQLPMDTRLMVGNNNTVNMDISDMGTDTLVTMDMANIAGIVSTSGESYYPGELTPPVSLHSSPEADNGLLIVLQKIFPKIHLIVQGQPRLGRMRQDWCQWWRLLLEQGVNLALMAWSTWVTLGLTGGRRLEVKISCRPRSSGRQAKVN